MLLAMYCTCTAAMITLLLKAQPPADVHARDDNGNTALHLVCRELEFAGAGDDDGLTDSIPAHEGAFVIKLLLDAGADVLAPNDAGRSPVEAALLFGRARTVAALRLCNPPVELPQMGGPYGEGAAEVIKGLVDLYDGKHGSHTYEMDTSLALADSNKALEAELAAVGPKLHGVCVGAALQLRRMEGERAGLEADRTAITAEMEALRAARAALASERAAWRTTLVSQRAAWRSERAAGQADLDRARAAQAAEATAAASERAALTAERAVLRQERAAHAAERAAWERARGEAPARSGGGGAHKRAHDAAA